MKGSKKHILIVNRSFWPDVEATGQFFSQLSQQLALDYKITVLAGRSYYHPVQGFKKFRLYQRESFQEVEIIRVGNAMFWKKNLIGRFINWLTYGVLCFCALLGLRPDLIIVGTDPPFLGILAMVIKRLKFIPFIYDCNDLYPEVALGLGKIKPGFLSKIYDSWNIKALKASRCIICPGISMQEKLTAKGINPKQVIVIPHWADTSVIKPVKKEENPLFKQLGIPDKFILMYSGNLGISQGFDVLMDSLKLVNQLDWLYLIFAGGGAGKDNLQAKVDFLQLKNVLFLPYQPLDKLIFSLGLADLHLVTLKKGMAGAECPSKIYGIMAAAKPYLAITDNESEPARLAKEYGCGLWAAPDDPAAVAEKINWAMQHPEELKEMGNLGRKLAETSFDKNIVISQWFKIIEEKIA